MNDQNRKELSGLIADYDKYCTSGMSISAGHAAWEALVRYIDNLISAARDEGLQAARATPAQPVPMVDDLAMLIRRLVHALHKAKPDSTLATQAVDYLRRHGLQGSPLRDVSAPSPSSVGDAIRAMPLPYVKVPPNGAQTQWGRDMANCGAEVMREHIIALLPKLLSEAAALAEQVQGQQW